MSLSRSKAVSYYAQRRYHDPAGQAWYRTQPGKKADDKPKRPNAPAVTEWPDRWQKEDFIALGPK